MPANFSVQFIVNEKTSTRVLKLTDTSTGFTLAKGNFSITFPDGSTRIKTDFTSPDISAPSGFINIPAVLDNNNNVITGTYKIDFVALNASSTTYSSSISFDFNWVKPLNGIVNLSDVLIPEVKFQDTASYSPIGSFTGTLNRTLSAAFPSTSEASGASISTVSSSTIDMVSSGKYYDGTYTPSSDININYTSSSDNRITISYIELFTKSILIKRCPTQVELVVKINNYRALIDAYKEKNDTQFNILSEQYDLVIALYSHLITRYETSTQDGSEPVLRELLSILEPYITSYTPQLTRMLPFEIASTGTNSFNISDGTNTDAIPLGSTILLSSGNPAFTIGVSNNMVTYTPVFGTTSNTFTQGNDSRLHSAVTIGTANGLSLASQVLSLASATVSTSGAMSASDKAKLDGIAAGANTGTVTSVGISAPSAFAVANSPVTTSGTINISATGSPSQYITGAGALATFLTDVRAGISLTTTGTSGAATYSSSTGILNIPQYQGGVTSFNTRTGAITLTSSDVTTALTYTPYNATNPDGYITGITSSNVTTALGYTPYNATNPDGYITGITSSNVTTALGFTPENAANKGIANGYASLDGGGLVPSTQLPSYVDDVLEYADLASFPATGTTGKIYVDLATNKIYRWSGTVYVEISSSAGGGGTWGSITGTLSNQTDLQNALNAKQDDITLTTTGTSGAATFIGNTLNIPNYAPDLSGYVPYTGATTNVDLGEYSIKSGAFKFDLTPSGTLAEGTMQWNSSDGTVDIGLKGGNVVLQVGQETVYEVRNETGSTILSGTALYANGVTAGSGRITVDAYIADGSIRENRFLGLATEDISNGVNGFVTHFGYVRGLDTRGTSSSSISVGDETWAVGDILYVHPTVAGKLTNVKPQHEITVAIIINRHQSSGVLFVRPSSAGHLEDIHDIAISSVANNEGLFYDSASGLWKNKTIATVLGYTPYSAANPNNYIALTALSSSATGLTYTNTTGVFSLTSGYVIPTTTEESNWNTAYGWGNHASAGYLTTSSAASTYQPLDADLTAIAGLSGTSGFLKKTAANTWSLDTNTYLTSFTETDPIYVASSWYTTTNNASNWDTAYGWGNHASAGYLTTSTAASTYQPLDADLTAIAGLTGTSGFLKKTAANTWSLDTSTYLTSISSSDVTTALGYTPVTNARTLTINGTAFDLTANRSWTISGSDSTKLPLAGGTMTGQIVSTVTEAIKINSDNCYISGWNSAGTTRRGYLQFATNSLNLFSEAGTALNLGANGATRIYVTAGGNTGMGTTSPLSILHLFGGGLTLNSSGTSDVAGGMRMVSHSVTRAGSNKFIKINAGTNNFFTGFIIGFNLDNYPPNGTVNTGGGFLYQFGGWSDGNGAHGDKYFDLGFFGGNNVGNLGREMNTDGYGYIITTPTSTGAGGYKASATIFIFARDMSKLSFTYY
jgi:hypothetical protein